jgi:ABC-type nitrate/sulfonate/bicarbonate transport system substrate-binding protein
MNYQNIAKMKSITAIFVIVAMSIVSFGGTTHAVSSLKNPSVKWTVKKLSAKSSVSLINLIETDSIGLQKWQAKGACTIVREKLKMASPGNCDLKVDIAKQGAWKESSKSKSFKVEIEKPVEIRLGCFTGPQLIWAYYLIDNAAKNGLKLKCQKITNFADAQIAIEAGQTDIAPLGYHQLATIRANKLWVIDGYARGGNELIITPKTKINAWSDLNNKTIGVFVGSWAKILFDINIKEKNIKLKNLVLFNSVPAMLAAFKSGEVDGIFAFETINGNTVLNLGGSYAPLDYADNSVGDLNGIIAVTKSFALEHPVLVTKFLKEVINAQNALKADRNLWAALTARESGATLAVSETSVSRTQFVASLNETAAQNMCAVAFSIGVSLTNETGCAKGLLNYDFLTEATGKTAKELGRNS